MAIDKKVNVIISSVDRYSSGLANFRGSMLMVLGGIIAIEAALLAVSIGMAKFAVSMATTAVKSAIDFHDAIINVVAVAQSFGTTTEQVDEILKQLTIDFPVTGAAAGKAMEMVAQMGYGGAVALDQLSRAALTLELATGVDLDMAVRGLTTTMNALELEIDQVDRVMNLFAAAQFTSGASAEKLTEAMKFAAPQARLLGMSIEDVVAMLAMFIDNGLLATQAGRTFRMGMAKVFKETDDGAAVLAKLGITYKDLQAVSNDASKFIAAFGGATLGAKEAALLFGVEASSMALIINKGAKSFDNYKDTIVATTMGTDAAAIKLGAFENVAKNVEGSMDALKDTIGRDLLKAVIDLVGKDAASGLRGIITELTKLEEKQGFIGGPLVEAFTNLKAIAQDVFKEAFGDAQGLYLWLSNLSVVLSKNVEIIGIYAAAFIKAFAQSTGDTKNLISLMKTLNVAWGAISLVIAVVHDLFVGFVYAWELGFASIQTIWDAVHIRILIGIGNIYKALDLLPTKKFDFTKEIAANEAQVAKLTENMASIFDVAPPKLWTGAVRKAYSDADFALQGMLSKQQKVTGEQQKVTGEVKLTAEQVAALGNEYQVVGGKLGKIAIDERDISDIAKEWLKGTDGVFSKKEEISKTVSEIKVKEENLSDIAKEWLKGTEDVFSGMEKTSKVAGEIKVKQKDIAQTTTPEWAKGMDDIWISAKKVKTETVGIKNELNLTDDNIKSIVSNYRLVGGEAVKVGTEIKGGLLPAQYEMIDGVKVVLNYWDDVQGSQKDIVGIQGEMVDGVKTYASYGDELFNSTKKVKDETKELAVVTGVLGKRLKGLSKNEITLETAKFKSELKIIEIDAKASHELVQTAMEYEGKIDLERIKADAVKVKAIFGGIADSVQAAADASASMFSSLMGGMTDLGTLDKWFMQDVLKDQMKVQSDLAGAQTKLVTAQANLLQAQVASITKDGVKVNVTIQGNTAGWLAGLTESLLTEIFMQAEVEGFQCFGV